MTQHNKNRKVRCRMTGAEFVEAAMALWGEGWLEHAQAAFQVDRSTIYRWRKRGLQGPALALMRRFQGETGASAAARDRSRNVPR